MYLNCRTYYSWRYGTFATEELVNKALELGVNSLALTNINSTCDLWQFVKLCQEGGIKPITGVEIRNKDKLLYILIAANNDGLTWIHEFLSTHLINKKEFPEIIFLDLNMPEQNGLDFLDAFSGFTAPEKSSTKVILLMNVVNSSDEVTLKATSHPLVRHVIEKPLTEDKLRNIPIG